MGIFTWIVDILVKTTCSKLGIFCNFTKKFNTAKKNYGHVVWIYIFLKNSNCVTINFFSCVKIFSWNYRILYQKKDSNLFFWQSLKNNTIQFHNIILDIHILISSFLQVTFGSSQSQRVPWQIYLKVVEVWGLTHESVQM